MIADCLNNTENDILRAFRYWETEGLLRLEKDADGRISGIELQKAGLSQNTAKASGTPAQAPEQSSAALRKVQSLRYANRRCPRPRLCRSIHFRAQKELKSLLFHRGTVSREDSDPYGFRCDHLLLWTRSTCPADLIEYLIETCVENGHKSMHYIQKVALFLG